MSEFKFNGRTVYYEVHGERGTPLLLLNGIMMSVNSWKPFVKTFSQNNRLILVDFFDQGRSARMDCAYAQNVQADLTAALLDVLALDKVCVMGISYGGEVALRFALEYPQRVERLILANTAARTSAWLRDIGHCWNAAAATGDGRLYYLTTIPVIYSTEFYESHAEWMKAREKTLVPYFSQPDVLSALVRLTDSAENYDVTARLGEISCPTLIISAQSDIITPITEQNLLHACIKDSKHVIINDSGHASMYEQPAVFAALVLGFANQAETRYEI